MIASYKPRLSVSAHQEPGFEATVQERHIRREDMQTYGYMTVLFLMI